MAIYTTLPSSTQTCSGHITISDIKKNFIITQKKNFYLTLRSVFKITFLQNVTMCRLVESHQCHRKDFGSTFRIKEKRWMHETITTLTARRN